MRETGGTGGEDRIERGEAFTVAGFQGAVKDGRGREGERKGEEEGCEEDGHCACYGVRVEGRGWICIRVHVHYVDGCRSVTHYLW